MVDSSKRAKAYRAALLYAAISLYAASALAGAPKALATTEVHFAGAKHVPMQSFDGVVEPVRQVTLAAQVSGAIVYIGVQVGDKIRAGQELLRMDARAAGQLVQAGTAQVESARVALRLASRDLERQQKLLDRQYISPAALDHWQAQFQAAQAQLQTAQAQSDASQTQYRFFVITAPFAGVVSEVPVTLGDMAMPGRPLVTLHDPAKLRVSATVAQSALPPSLDRLQYELPAWSGSTGLSAVHGASVLPLADAATHSAQVRFPLPSLPGVMPGMFVRVWLPDVRGAPVAGGRLFVASTAVLRRAELTAVYRVDAQGRPTLRQVRLGRSQGDEVEVLSGLQAGDKVASDPQAAAAQLR